MWFPAPAHSAPARRVYLYSVGGNASTPVFLGWEGHGNSSSSNGGLGLGDIAMTEDAPS